MFKSFRIDNWNIKKISKIFNIAIFSLLLFCFATQSLYASIGDRVRSEIRYNSSTQLCDKEELKFDPFFTGNPDVNWEISNPVCLTLMVTSVLAANTADYFTAKQCNPLDATAEVNAALKASFFNPALLMIGVAKNGGMCGSYASICAFNPDPVTKAAACQSAARCCAGWGAQIATYGAMVGSFAIVYKVAKDAYEDARVCGHNWLSWKDINGVQTKGAYEGSRAKAVSDLVKNSLNNSVADQYYREFIYGGVEYEDDHEEACKNPSGWSDVQKIKYLGYATGNQRYYMKGPKETPSFACYRFLVGDDKKSEAESFECCQNRSQNTICVERNNGYKFCKIGDNKCFLKNKLEGIVYYNIYESRKNAGYICAETYSVCPYNHPLGGGTEDMSNNSNADGNPNSYNIANFCQYMYHCSKIPNKLYFKTSNLTGSFISQSCRDMKGDSQNNYNSTASIIGTNSFSSAIVQCFKETLENAFFNKAGYTKCVDANEEVKDGVCDSGYIQKKGQPLFGDSFFVKIQKKLKDVIKILLTLSVIFLGGKIAMGEEINKKLIFGYIAKIAVIIYFVIGDAWQAHFMKGVMDSSNFLAGLMFSSDYDLDAKKAKDTNKNDDINFLDGCQFPRYNYSNSSDFNNPKYAPGNEYLKMWDTLDCKIARAIGMAPGATTANIILTILAGFFTGGLGILFVIAVLAFAIFLIHLVIQAFHMFLVSMLAIIILIFVSPITITMALFDKTKNIFDSWLSELLGYAFQPMIIYAYLGIFIALFDTAIVGKETMFQGDGEHSPKKTLCSNQGNNVNTNASNSIYCIFGLTKVQNYTGFEALSIGIPQLVGLIDNKLAIITILKSAFLFIIFSFAGAKIPDLARALVGGSSVADGGNWSSAGKAFGQLTSIYSSIRSTQQKGMGMARKLGSSVNNARRENRYNLDKNSSKKDQAISGDKSSQQSQDNLLGGAQNVPANQASDKSLQLLKEEQKPVQQIQQSEEAKKQDNSQAQQADKKNEDMSKIASFFMDVAKVGDEISSGAGEILGYGKNSGSNLQEQAEEMLFSKGNDSEKNWNEYLRDDVEKPLEETFGKATEQVMETTAQVANAIRDTANQALKSVDELSNQVSKEFNSSINDVNKNIGDAYEYLFGEGNNSNEKQQSKDKQQNQDSPHNVNKDLERQNRKEEQVTSSTTSATITEDTDKTISNKLLIGNQKRSMADFGARILKDSYLVNGSGERKFLGKIDKEIEKNFKDPSNIRMREFAMNASEDQIKTLKNNMIESAIKKGLKFSEKEFNQNMLKAAQAYEQNKDLKDRDSKELAEKSGISEEDAQAKMNQKYQERIKRFTPKNDSKK